MEKWAKNHGEQLRFLYQYIPSTAIDKETGVAREKQLRRTQVTIPVTLAGYVESECDDDWVSIIRQACRLVRHLGKQRKRGYGRVSTSLEENSNETS
jgi:hypothetical protein